ncbi:hypothetical protein E4U44_002754 [Claviceps purpurea]|nr:hypothetical protein E4U44_002754 [Claviceps purpurea]
MSSSRVEAWSGRSRTPTCQGRRQPHEGIASPRPPLPVGRESKQQAAADAAANYEVAADARARQEANHRMADADVYKTRIDAEADNYAAQKRAEAYAVSQIKEAEGIAVMADAYAKMATAFGGPAGLIQYMMIEKSTYIELAKANAEAICGLQPKISVWNTGGGGGSGGNETGGES